MQRVLVGMSGGVDSSVAALLLQRAGYDVIGATMELLPKKGTEPFFEGQTTPEKGSVPFSEAPCCDRQAAERARLVCDLIRIPHCVINLTDQFRRDVIDRFVAEYRRGRTPNPCLRCNQLIKWGELLRQARDIGCDLIATGHYAAVERAQSGRMILRRGAHRPKDQSYALYMLSQDELAHTLLPLGALTKQQVRQIAADAGLPTAKASESQDICFVPDGDYRVLFGAEAMQPGPIEDIRGNLLGEHRGLPAYTVGQRKGLGVAVGEPLYVIRKDLARNAIVVGTRREAVRRLLRVEGLSWLSLPPPDPGALVEAEVEIRYRARPIPGTVHVISSDIAQVQLARTDQIAAPGQSAVFYRDDLVLGGGVITEA